MDLRRSDLDGLNSLAELWMTTPGAEFEAMLTGVDLTAWQDIIQYLRSLGMRENPQIVKMNICLSNDIRITLEGAGAIHAYCRDNRISDKPFVAMLKENIAGAEPVQFGSYSARAKLKREIPLARDDVRVKEVVARWDALGKHFRNIQRFEFVAPGGIPMRFDVSLVRENAGRPSRTFQESRVTSAPAQYEVEVELTASRETTNAKGAVAHILRGLSWLLQGRQRSYVLVSNQTAISVRDSLSAIFGLGSEGNRRNGNRNRVGPTPVFRFPGPQPATLERKNIVVGEDPSAPNLLTTPGGYNVTDKADGLRCLLYVTDNGMIYLVDGGGRVYATGRRTDKSQRGLVLDGEWIRRNRSKETVSHYYAFDILATPGGDISVTNLPFVREGVKETRLAALEAAVSMISKAAQTVANIPTNQNIQFGMKTFRSNAGIELFTVAASSFLDEAARTSSYNTDGLIFTPNDAPLPIGRGTWAAQLKWKPPHENTIDFLVIVERERRRDGTPTAVDAIGTKYREDAGYTVRYKTLRLFVGSSQDQAFADPRRTILSGEPLPRSLESNEWREVEFRPTEPRDPMASICYVEIGDGPTVSEVLDTETDVIRCTRTGDIIQSNMIVEMAYHPERAPGWRWEPIRIRHDKTERWLAQQAEGSRRGGTMNADWVANSIWTSIHNPVTETTIRTGRIVNCTAPSVELAPTDFKVYRAPSRDLMKAQCMRNFNTDYVKRRLLLRPEILRPGSRICDIGMGSGEDIPRWIASAVSYAFGCDVDANNINNPVDGAYRRLLDKKIALGDAVPPMTFVQADAARRLSNGEAGVTGEDKALLQDVFSKVDRFDVVSTMFSLSQMFRDVDTLDGFLVNLADTLKVGGYYVGCGLDGDAVARMLYSARTKGEMAVAGRDGEADVWVMRQRYGMDMGDAVTPSEAGLGMAVDIDMYVLGETRREYLMSWAYFVKRLEEVGLSLLSDANAVALGLPCSTQLFNDTLAAAETRGDMYEMSAALRRYTGMHRWWVMYRHTDARPRGPVQQPAPISTAALTQTMGMTAKLSEVTAPLSEVTAPLSEAPPTEVDLFKGLTTSMTAPAEAPVDLFKGLTAKLSTDLTAKPSEAPPAEVDLFKGLTAKPSVAGGGGGPITQLQVTKPEVTKPVNLEFLINVNKTDDRLKGYEDWPTYMSTSALVEIIDPATPSITYPSIEAALAAAKYREASTYTGKGTPNTDELVRTLFSVGGSIHQDFEIQRKKLRDAGADIKKITDLTEKEMNKMRTAAGPDDMAKRNYSFNRDMWTQVRKSVYKRLLEYRYRTDDRFKTMVDMINGMNGEILYANGPVANEVGVGVVLLDKKTQQYQIIRTSETITGDNYNMIGKVYMELH